MRSRNRLARLERVEREADEELNRRIAAEIARLGIPAHLLAGSPEEIFRVLAEWTPGGEHEQ